MEANANSSMIKPSNLINDENQKQDRVNEVKAIIESVPKRDSQTRPALDDKQEKIKQILREAYTDVRVAQSKIVEKVNQVKYLTERTEALKKELSNSLGRTHENNLKALNIQHAMLRNTVPQKNVDDSMFFETLLAAQENIDLLLMDSLFESINTVDVIDSIKNQCQSNQSQNRRFKSESLQQLESENVKWSSEVLTIPFPFKKSPSGNFIGLMKQSNKKFGSSNDVSQSDEQFYSMNSSSKGSFDFDSLENFKSMTNSVDSYLDKQHSHTQRMTRSKSMNGIRLGLKFNESCYSLNESDHMASKTREWTSSDFNFHNNLSVIKCDQSEDEYFSICSSLKTTSVPYPKNTQFDSYCSLNLSENASSGFHSFSNLKSQDEDSNETLGLQDEPNGIFTSSAKKDREICIRKNNKISSFMNDSNVESIVSKTNGTLQEKSPQKFREINIFSSFFVLFVYFDLRIFLFVVAIFNWAKHFFSSKCKRDL
jgi:hypothetical protein